MNNFLIQKADRAQTKIKLHIAGPSGSGKTYGALQLGSGLAEWSEICVIDTERGSSSLYSHLGGFYTLQLEAPFTPEKYVQAIQAVIEAGFKVCIIDSISHEWDGKGGILELHDSMSGNSFTNWSKLTPRHNAFVNAIVDAPIYVITCGRSKQDYVLTDKNGKMVPEKVGLKTVTREGFDYEVTLSFDLDIKHWATASKDRTGLFMDKPQFIISSETGLIIKQWCESGRESPVDSIYQQFKDCIDLNKLKVLGAELPKAFQLTVLEIEQLRKLYILRRDELIRAKSEPSQLQQNITDDVPPPQMSVPEDELIPELVQNMPPQDPQEQVDLPFPETDPKSPTKILDKIIYNLENSMSVSILDGKYSGLMFHEEYNLIDDLGKTAIDKTYKEKREKLMSSPDSTDNYITPALKKFSECKNIDELNAAIAEVKNTAIFALSNDAEREILNNEYLKIKKGFNKKTDKKGAKK